MRIHLCIQAVEVQNCHHVKHASFSNTVFCITGFDIRSFILGKSVGLREMYFNMINSPDSNARCRLQYLIMWCVDFCEWLKDPIQIQVICVVFQDRGVKEDELQSILNYLLTMHEVNLTNERTRVSFSTPIIEQASSVIFIKTGWFYPYHAFYQTGSFTSGV